MEPTYSTVAITRRDAAQVYAGCFMQKYPHLSEKLSSRLAKAVDLASTAGACRETEEPGVYLVQSSKPHHYHQVNTQLHTCTCEDFQFAPAHLCKHRLTIGLKLCGPDWLTAAMLITFSAAGDAQRLFATHLPTGQRVEVIDYTKTTPAGQRPCVALRAKFIDTGREIINAPRSDFAKFFIGY
jgi:hypothetical protein